MRSECPEIPNIINGKPSFSSQKLQQLIPTDNSKALCTFNQASEQDIQNAIDSCMAAKAKWGSTPFTIRSAIFLKAAHLMATKYRPQLLAAIMLGQGKTVYQYIDFFHIF